MEDLGDFKVVDFGMVQPGKAYSKQVEIKNDRTVIHYEESKHTNPLEKVFTLKPVEDSDGFPIANKFTAEYKPSLPHRKYFSYQRLEFEDGSKQFVYLKGKTCGPNVKLSTSKIYFQTNTKVSTSHFLLKMENSSDCRASFCWDFATECSEVQISPMSGSISSNGHVDVSIAFQPMKIGLFYRAFPCLIENQEPLFVEIIGFHSKSPCKLDLDKYVLVNERLPRYPTNHCRYLADSAPRISPESKPIVSSSRRHINFGNIPVVEGSHFAAEDIFLTNHADKDLVVEWKSSHIAVFKVEPSVWKLNRNGGIGKFAVKFQPNTPELFYFGELWGSFLWGVNNEYTVPFTVTVDVIGDSFSHSGCGWGWNHCVDRTRIVLPGTIPYLPAYATLRISRNGNLPLQYSLRPVDEQNASFFTLKPMQGVISEPFQLVVIQFYPQGNVDVIFKEEWYLTINKLTKVKLEICGSMELPFLLVGWDKNVHFPPTTLGSIVYLPVPVKNPTRLELEYQCLQSLSPGTFEACKEIFPIGPGEQQHVEIQFRPEKLGDTHTSMGISVKWAPYHAGALKSLCGRIVHAETVVNLFGKGEADSIKASPTNLSISDVILNDWGEASFFLHNHGNSTANVRLECRSNKWYSKIGPSKLVPNDLTLVPNTPIEIKLYLLGIERGFNPFVIFYKLYESPQFKREASQHKELLRGAIFVTYPSLKIEDLRFDGLAKSLSKLFMWKLLKINSLNDIFETLERNQSHFSHMKIPEFLEKSPRFIIQLLVKNTCAVPLSVQVHMMKNCLCPPRKADSISRRLLDYSCQHEDEMAAEIRDEVIQPSKRTVITITAEYEVTDNCEFSLTLNVATHPGKKWMTSIRIDVERGIIAADKISLSFLLLKTFGSKTYHVTLEDAYLGIGSTFQILWLYNHSQFPCRYWSEWLMVNNKVFQLVNTQGIIPPYTSRPLFVRFTPYEMKTYEATLAVVNEAGVEFHVMLAGKGTTSYDLSSIRMRDKMPAVSLFDDAVTDLELSLDHISIRAMPTHSFDKYALFMINNSTDVIRFCWEKLIVWSTLKVVVKPKDGELQPGEIFPIQVHVHTYRQRATFNFAIGCIYYRKEESDIYFERSQHISDLSKTFDACFVLESDKKIGMAYRNPRLGGKCGPTPKNRIITLGGSIRIFGHQYMNIVAPGPSRFLFIPNIHLPLRQERSYPIISKHRFYELAETMKKIVYIAMHGDLMKQRLMRKRPIIRYIDLPNVTGFEMSKLSGRQLGMLLSNILYSTTVRLFGLDPVIYHEGGVKIDGNRDQSNAISLYNDYYERMLSEDVDQVSLFNPQGRIRRAQSRDNLSVIQRT